MNFVENALKFLLYSFIVLLFSGKLFFLEAKQTHNVLVIHSYHQKFEWTNKIGNGIQSILSNQTNIKNVFVEYLDSKRHQSKPLYYHYANLFKEKYNKDSISVIIVSDNFAFDFVLEYQEKLFKNIPIVFCGLNYYTSYKEKIGNNITGVAEVNEVDSSLSIARSLFPNITDVAIITDTTVTSQYIYNESFHKLKKQNPDLKFHTFTNLSEQKLFLAVESLPKQSICLQLGYFFDEDGKYEDYNYRLKQLSNTTSFPIFAVWEFFLGKGILGGKLTNPFDQGSNAAKLGLQILSGKKVKDISVLKSVGNRWMFDYKMLAKNGISTLLLPSGSIIINEPKSNYSINKYVIVGVGFILSFLILIVLALYQHIIKRREIEAELLDAKAKAEKATKLKSEFLAQISHEIRTPINNILNFTSLIKSDLEDSMDEETAYSFKIIESAGDRTVRTIDLILNMSEMQAGTYEFTKTKFKLIDDVLEKLREEFNNSAKNKGLELIIVNNTDNTIIEADHYSVMQIFSNLINNAIKYTNRGSVTVIVDKNNKGAFEVEVSDTGIGISEEYLPKLFIPFSQEEQGYTRRFDGNGLGLALVLKYCKMNNIEIKVSSKKNKGTTFNILFPI